MKGRDSQINEIAEVVAAKVLTALNAPKADKKENGLLSLHEVALKLRKCDQVIRNLQRRDRQFPNGIKVGNGYFFEADDIDRYIAIKKGEYKAEFKFDRQLRRY